MSQACHCACCWTRLVPLNAAAAAASDGTSGCTYPSASNFDSAATHNDASCVWTVVGCADSDALTAAAKENDGRKKAVRLWTGKDQKNWPPLNGG